MNSSVAMQRLELIFRQYEKAIFTNLIWYHLFDEENRYLDADYFVKSEKYLRSYFEQCGFEWNEEIRRTVRSLVLNSAYAKSFDANFENNYQNCLKYMLEWKTEKSATLMIQQLINTSIQCRMPLDYGHAKNLLTFYYYYKFYQDPNRAQIIRNAMTIFFTDCEIVKLIEKAQKNFDQLIIHSYNEFVAIIPRYNQKDKVDGKVFIRKFVMLDNLHKYWNDLPDLREQIINSKYLHIFEDQLAEIGDKLPEEKPEKEATETLVQEKENVKEQASAERKEKIEEKAQTEKEVQKREDEFDVFLEKIGKKVEKEENPIAKLLMGAEQLLQQSEAFYNVDLDAMTCFYKEDFFDIEIEELNY